MKSRRIAIASTNRQRYSETFIQSHLQFLAEEVLYLFDGYLPTKFSTDKLKTEHPIVSLESLLKENKIHVVLAEYGPGGAEMATICKALSIPLVVHFHGFDAYRNDVINTYGAQYKTMFEIAESVIGVSKDMKAQLEKLGCPKDKIHYIPYGIHNEIFNIPNQSTKKQFVSCGRFVAKKGPQYTIEAFAKAYQQNPDISLVMIGDGELLDECRALAHQKGLQGPINFTGALRQSDISQIFSESICFLQHSFQPENKDKEGTPLSILEAGAAELPVISTLHAGIPDVIENGKDGFLVQEKDIDSMANKILFLSNNPSAAKEMGKHFQNKVLKFYSMERYMNDLKALLKINQKV